MERLNIVSFWWPQSQIICPTSKEVFFFLTSYIRGIFDNLLPIWFQYLLNFLVHPVIPKKPCIALHCDSVSRYNVHKTLIDQATLTCQTIKAVLKWFAKWLLALIVHLSKECCFVFIKSGHILITQTSKCEVIWVLPNGILFSLILGICTALVIASKTFFTKQR